MTITTNDIKRQYTDHPSLIDHLPWLEWSDKDDALLLEDGHSVGALLELRAMPTEAKPDNFIEQLFEKVTTLFSNIMPLEVDNPWVMQFFIQDELTLQPMMKRLHVYIQEKNVNYPDDNFANHYLEIMQAHAHWLCRDEGAFSDPLSHIAFRGKTKRLRVAVYRRYQQNKNRVAATQRVQQRADILEELNTTVTKLISRCQQMGLAVRRLRGEHLYNWLVRWFNPAPAMTEGNVNTLLEKFPYPKRPQQKPFSWRLAPSVFFSTPQSEPDGWVFDGMKHRVLLFKELRAPRGASRVCEKQSQH